MWMAAVIVQGLLLEGAVAPGANPPAAASQAEHARSAMSNSLERQQASVRRQLEAVKATPAGQHAAAVVPMPAATFDCEPVPATELTRMIGEASQRAGIDGGLIREVARQESGFRPCAVSPKGAQGLMQLMPVTQAQFAVENPFDPQQSLEAGSKLLKQLLDRYHGNLSLALSAYNAGAGCVDRSGGVPDIQETKNYVLNILSRVTGLASGLDSGELSNDIPSTPLLALSTDPYTPAGGCQPPVR